MQSEDPGSSSVCGRTCLQVVATPVRTKTEEPSGTIHELETLEMTDDERERLWMGVEAADRIHSGAAGDDDAESWVRLL